MRSKNVFLALLLALSPLGSAHATVILSNLPGTGTYKTAGQNLTSSGWEAVGVTTGAAAVTLNAFSGYFDNPIPPQASLDGGVYSDNSGNPGTLLSAFTSISVPGSLFTPTLETLTTVSGFTMQPSTTYWFVVHDAVTPLEWLQDNSTNGTLPIAAAGYALAGYRNSTNSGTAWTTPAAANSNYTVQITATPEPATLTLFGSALVLLGGMRLIRRRNR